MQTVLIQFEDENYNIISSTIQVPTTMTKDQLLSLINGPPSLNLYIDGIEIIDSLSNSINNINPEEIITITTHKDEKMARPSSHCSSSFSGHEGPVLCIKILSNCIISGGGDCTLRIWDRITKTQKKIIKRDNHWIMCLDANNDKIVTGAMDGRINVYDGNGEYKDSLLLAKDTITGIKIIDDIFIFSSRDKTVRVVKDRKVIFSYTHDHPVNGFIYKDRYLISYGRDGKVKIFYYENTFIFIKEIQMNSSVSAVEKNHNYFIIGCEDGNVYVYKQDTTNNDDGNNNDKKTNSNDNKNNKDNYNSDIKFVYKLQHSSTISSISSYGLFCATASFDKKIKIFNLSKGNIISSYVHNDWVYKIILNNNYVISSSKDKTIKVYDYKNKKMISDLICRDEVYCFDIEEEKIVAGCKDRMVYFFE
ncbi:WD repeat protein [Spraguea lophii 42_110]|uniref:WD repeat protein n=1 Tax=Spraguea lophii (strain 42_110) TaxID=1358809 RepID=S7W7J9_SPRLO|nr:WD repeat protein [Spraguea lophii 42_110]